MPGDSRVTARPVPWVGGWLLQATHPGGDVAAFSPSYPTQDAADHARRFLQKVGAALGDPEERGRIQPRSGAACACTRRGRTCLHHEPHEVPPRSTQGWEVIARGGDGSPIQISDPYPSGEEAEVARDFALRVTNGKHPIPLRGVAALAESRRPGYVPPDGEDAALTVRVKTPPPSRHTAGGYRPATLTGLC